MRACTQTYITEQKNRSDNEEAIEDVIYMLHNNNADAFKSRRQRKNARLPSGRRAR
jgi:hypothetical protein